MYLRVLWEEIRSCISLSNLLFFFLLIYSFIFYYFFPTAFYGFLFCSLSKLCSCLLFFFLNPSYLVKNAFEYKNFSLSIVLAAYCFYELCFLILSIFYFVIILFSFSLQHNIFLKVILISMWQLVAAVSIVVETLFWF